MGDRPSAPRMRSATFSSGTQSTGAGGRGTGPSTGRKKPMPTAELPPEAPKPDASQADIKKFIFDNNVCFFHARG